MPISKHYGEWFEIRNNDADQALGAIFEGANLRPPPSWRAALLPWALAIVLAWLAR